MGPIYDLFVLFSVFREPIIRTAFQSIQLVVTDFLLIISPTCLSLCVETAAKFGLQQSELNISLTAIGLLVRLNKGHIERATPC